MAVKSKRVKLDARGRLKARLKKKIRGTDLKPRLSVFKSDKHTYAQLISDESARTLASASTLDAAVIEKAANVDMGEAANTSRSTKSIAAATAVGLVLGERAKAAGVEQLVFDRNGFFYHGRIKAVADGARKAGLSF